MVYSHPIFGDQCVLMVLLAAFAAALGYFFIQKPPEPERRSSIEHQHSPPRASSSSITPTVRLVRSQTIDSKSLPLENSVSKDYPSPLPSPAPSLAHGRRPSYFYPGGDHRPVPVPAAHDHCNDDDETGHHVLEPEATIRERYENLQQLGRGSYGSVYMVRDLLSHRDPEKATRSALKMISNDLGCHETSRQELAVLLFINMIDRDRKSCCIFLEDFFYHQGHLCMLFPEIGDSLGDLIRYHKNVHGDRGMSANAVQSVASQLGIAMHFIHSHGILHNDLKPENILVIGGTWTRCPLGREDIERPVVRVIDFGFAAFMEAEEEEIVGTCPYRAPEVLLGLPVGPPSDMFSLGCIIAECVLARPVVDIREDYVVNGRMTIEGRIVHLYLMHNIFGPMPLPLARSAYYGKDGNDIFIPAPASTRTSMRLSFAAPNTRLLQRHGLPVSLNAQLGRRCDAGLKNLIKELLKWDPSARSTADRMLQDKYIDTSPYI